MRNSDLPAMPVFSSEHGYISGDATGLTKREYFAGLAMQAIADGGDSASMSKAIAAIAVSHADALLAELEKNNA